MALGMGYTKGGLTKKQIVWAQSETITHKQAAALLGCHIDTYRTWAKAYGIYDSFTNYGKGLKKVRKTGDFGLQTILDNVNGKFDNYSRAILKDRLIAAGWLEQKCDVCEYCSLRPFDNRGPFVMIQLDNNKNNLKLDNIRLRCYNCYYHTYDIRTQSPYEEYSEDKRFKPVFNEPVEIDNDDLTLDNQMTQEEIEEMQNMLMLSE